MRPVSILERATFRATKLIGTTVFAVGLALSQRPLVTISLEKETFHKLEPVILHVEIYHSGSKQRSYQYPLLSLPTVFRLSLMDGIGRVLQNRGIHQYHIGGESKKPLNQGETFNSFYDVNDWYGESDSTRFLPFLNPSTYSVFAEYWPDDTLHQIVSNTLHFTVLEASQTDPLDSDKWLNTLRLRKADRIDALRQIIDEMASSPFRKSALRSLVQSYLAVKDTTQARIYLQELVNESPDAFEAWVAIQSFSRNMSSLSKREMMEELILEYPKTLVGKMAEKTINRIQYK